MFGTELKLEDLWKLDWKFVFNGLPKMFSIYIHVPLIVRMVISPQNLFSSLFQLFILTLFGLVRSLVYEWFHFYKGARFVRMSFETSIETFDWSKKRQIGIKAVIFSF